MAEREVQLFDFVGQQRREPISSHIPADCLSFFILDLGSEIGE